MRNKVILIGALLLLLVVIGFMVRDLFFGKDDNINPYNYDLNAVRKGDTTQAAFTEGQPMKPACSEIHGLAIDKAGNIYVSGKDTVEVFDTTGKKIHLFRISGIARCIHVDSKNNIFLGMEDHVEIWDSQGNKHASWASCGEDAVITSIDCGEKDVFVADAGQKIVYRYDYSGKLLNKIGQKDPALHVPGFIVPSPYFDLALDKDGSLWVANTGRHSLERYEAGGKLLGAWGKASMDVTGFCGCCNPSNFCLLPDGSFVTSEKAIERVKIYNPRGEFSYVVAGPKSFVEGTRGLDLAIGFRGEIVVLDPEKRLVRFFVPKKKQA